jgi:hypothetical protein
MLKRNLNRNLLGWLGAGVLAAAIVPGVSFAKSRNVSPKAGRTPVSVVSTQSNTATTVTPVKKKTAKKHALKKHAKRKLHAKHAVHRKALTTHKHPTHKLTRTTTHKKAAKTT